MFRSAGHAINDAHDEQPNDRKRQTDQDKCHRGTDNHCEHAIFLEFLFLHFDPAPCRAKKAGREPRLATMSYRAQESVNIGSCRPPWASAIEARSNAAT
jgi:hypothetical protein